MYEPFDHTADLGLRVQSDTLAGLFADAGRGLMAMIAEPPATIPAPTSHTLTLEAEKLDWLFFDWLRELLWLCESESVLFVDFEVEVQPEPPSLEARISSVPFDPATTRTLHEVKAITYHGLRVQREAAGWVAEVIVDI